MARRPISRWPGVALLAACGLFSVPAGGAMAAPEDSDIVPVLQTSRLQAAPSELHDDRFQLRVRVTPAAVQGRASGDFVLRTALTPKGAAICDAGLLFRDGFESP